jgi:hypothetical protein
MPPPVETPMLDASGRVTAPWANFFNVIYRYEKIIDASVADGTYTLGLGSTDGEITLTNGIITTIQEVVA